MENKIGQLVKNKREELGLSLREFGALCAMSHTHIDSIEKGYDVRSGRAVNLTSTTIKKLALALGVKEAELMKVNLGENTEVGKVTDSELKYALFGDSAISDSMLDEVKKFAEFIKSRGDTCS